MKAAWDKQGAVPLTMSPAEFDAYLRKDIEKWAKVVKASGLQPAAMNAARSCKKPGVDRRRWTHIGRCLFDTAQAR